MNGGPHRRQAYTLISSPGSRPPPYPPPAVSFASTHEPVSSSTVSPSAFRALLLPVFLPRTITAAGTGLTMVIRPLYSRFLGCTDTQAGFVAAASPLVSHHNVT